MSRIPGTPRRHPPRRALVLFDSEQLEREPVRSIVAAARAMGCMCDPPDYDVVERFGPAIRIVVYHARGCPLCPPLDDEAFA